MNSTIEVLRAESKRLRSLATKIDALIAEIDLPTSSVVTRDLPGLAESDLPRSRNMSGEFANMKQQEAILKALEYGPQNTKELLARLNAGGQSFKNTTYVSAVVSRMADRLTRHPGGKITLKAAAADKPQSAA